MTQARAREALEAQGFTTPGPKLIELVMDAIAREEEKRPAGVRIHTVESAEILADTPELIDRTTGPLTNPDQEVPPVVADVLNGALRYLFDDDTHDSALNS